ncbi:MAG: hypothetical protein NE330_05025, partial [Lentisphaeraceae bacterium]|nr:hypothetical protein [Lentisphaeraceae bacterium]
MLTREQLLKLKTRNDLIDAARDGNVKTKKHLRNLRYEEELLALQAQLVNLQRWVSKKNKRVAIIFEGRDAAGKGGSIKRF